MLDALVTEARLRFGLDLSRGLQVVPTEGLVAIPIEASRPLIVAPVTLLAPVARPPDGDGPLPGRHGPGGADPVAVLRRLYPADHPIGRFGGPDGLTIGTLGEADLGAPLYLAPLPAEEAMKQEVQPVQQDATPPSPVVLDAEPDYRADYLNNPRPPYPMVARRMGYHGKVVLNVEVLAEGRAGEVKLHQSCGYDILDNAALQTVKTWRFSPARRFGQPVTQWFLVPIKFSLEGNEA